MNEKHVPNVLILMRFWNHAKTNVLV